MLDFQGKHHPAIRSVMFFLWTKREKKRNKAIKTLHFFFLHPHSLTTTEIMFNLLGCDLFCPFLSNGKISLWANICSLGQMYLCAKSTLADQAWLCLHVFIARPPLRKWFCILTKCTVTFLYLLRAPPPPTRRGNQHCYSPRKLPRGCHGNCSAFSSYFSGWKGRGKEREEKAPYSQQTEEKLGSFLIRVQMKKVTVMCGRWLK